MKTLMAVLCVMATGVLLAAPFQQPAISLKPDLSGNARTLGEWDLDGSGVWTIEGGTLNIVKAGVPAGPIRKPAAIAVLKMPAAVRATIEAEVKSLAPVDVLERDLQLICGYESATRFYYVHMAGRTNDVHNGIFLVDNADRKRLDDGKAAPLLKDQSWHKARLSCDGSTGEIAIYFDGAATPAMKVIDKTIPAGRVGVASFDDIGQFRAIAVTGTAR